MEIINRQLKEIKEFEINKSILEKKEIFKSKRLFKCILGLNDLESNLLSYLITHRTVGTVELSKKLNMERSSIQKALQNLINLKLIKREALSLNEYSKIKKNNCAKKRGYLFVYNAEDVVSIKNELRKLLNKFYSSMNNYIENLESLFDCFESNGELCS